MRRSRRSIHAARVAAFHRLRRGGRSAGRRRTEATGAARERPASAYATQARFGSPNLDSGAAPSVVAAGGPYDRRMSAVDAAPAFRTRAGRLASSPPNALFL